MSINLFFTIQFEVKTKPTSKPTSGLVLKCVKMFYKKRINKINLLGEIYRFFNIFKGEIFEQHFQWLCSAEQHDNSSNPSVISDQVCSAERFDAEKVKHFTKKTQLFNSNVFLNRFLRF